ncbi:MAG: DUF3179 domain-containing protein [Phycisphaerae bacterium]|jgi:hypothetical protein|nr:DUF3179 domain-containing protein [Phycisphaerae bacterium]
MSDKKIRLTFAGGGWVIVMTITVLLALITWAIAPAVFRMSTLPPGDNETIESYRFDLTNLSMEKEMVVPAMRHRNMSPVSTSPLILNSTKIKAMNNSNRDPLLVSKDLVVGVKIDDDIRAYPLHFLHVHEIINDTLGGKPIAVIWHWPSGQIAVFERTVHGSVAEFLNSGLSGNGGMLLYERQTEVGGEQLYSTLLGNTVTGSDKKLIPVIHDVVPWSDWHRRFPETTVVAPNEQLKKRYRKASPELYFLNNQFYFPTSPKPEDAFSQKTPVIVVGASGITKIYALEQLLSIANENSVVTDTVGDVTVEITIFSDPLSARVQATSGEIESITNALWFAWYANYPTATITVLTQQE